MVHDPAAAQEAVNRRPVVFASRRLSRSSGGSVGQRGWKRQPVVIWGVDHKRLIYKFQGRDFRLTDVHGEVVRALMV
jgi:hypothetical protein